MLRMASIARYILSARGNRRVCLGGVFVAGSDLAGAAMTGSLSPAAHLVNVSQRRDRASRFECLWHPSPGCGVFTRFATGDIASLNRPANGCDPVRGQKKCDLQISFSVGVYGCPLFAGSTKCAVRPRPIENVYSYFTSRTSILILPSTLTRGRKLDTGSAEPSSARLESENLM